MSINLYFIPKNPKFIPDEQFIASVKIVALIKSANLERFTDEFKFNFNIDSKDDEDIGFGMDFVKDCFADWKLGFDDENEEPKSNIYMIGTHSSSFDFSVDFLKALNNELKEKFKIFDPQASKFIE